MEHQELVRFFIFRVYQNNFSRALCERSSVSIAKSAFDTLSKNEIVLVECVTGRFSRKFYLKVLLI